MFGPEITGCLGAMTPTQKFCVAPILDVLVTTTVNWLVVPLWAISGRQLIKPLAALMFAPTGLVGSANPSGCGGTFGSLAKLATDKRAPAIKTWFEKGDKTGGRLLFTDTVTMNDVFAVRELSLTFTVIVA